MPFYATILALYMLISAACDIDPPAMHRITHYWPNEDHWGNAVADPEIMKHGDPGIESWGYPWVAVNDLKAYPFGTLIFIEDIGFKWVHDHCPQFDTIDIRVPEKYMDMREDVRVWIVWRNDE